MLRICFAVALAISVTGATAAPPATGYTAKVAVSGPTRLDWTFVASKQSLADPPARLLAVIELVSPANKKSPDVRRAFVAKSVAYLHHGIGLVVVDPVTERHFNLHNDVARELAGNDLFALAGAPSIYTAAYRPIASEATASVEGWAYPLVVGAALPSVPLYLRGHGFVPLDLEATYTETRRRARF